MYGDIMAAASYTPLRTPASSRWQPRVAGSDAGSSQVSQKNRRYLSSHADWDHQIGKNVQTVVLQSLKKLPYCSNIAFNPFTNQHLLQRGQKGLPRPATRTMLHLLTPSQMVCQHGMKRENLHIFLMTIMRLLPSNLPPAKEMQNINPIGEAGE